jgi:hypothetical protein
LKFGTFEGLKIGYLSIEKDKKKAIIVFQKNGGRVESTYKIR